MYQSFLDSTVFLDEIGRDNWKEDVINILDFVYITIKEPKILEDYANHKAKQMMFLPPGQESLKWMDEMIDELNKPLKSKNPVNSRDAYPPEKTKEKRIRSSKWRNTLNSALNKIKIT